MKAKKWLASVGVTTMLIGGVLSGCSGGSSGSSEDSGDNVEITLAGWGGNPSETRLLKEALDSFEEKHPNIKVKQEEIPDQ